MLVDAHAGTCGRDPKKQKTHAAVQLGELREVFIVFMQMYSDR